LNLLTKKLLMMSIETKIINKDTFNKMKTAYDKNIKPKLGDAYTNYVSVSVQDLKDYISLIEKEANENGTKAKDILFNFVSSEDNGQLTLAFVPAFENAEMEGSIMNRHTYCPPFCGNGNNH